MVTFNDKDPIIVLGTTGQLGKAICHILGTKAIGLGSNKLDLSKPETIKRTLEKLPVPLAIINAAAYTKVDQAEKEKRLAKAINSDSVAELAEYAARNHIPLVHYSTDYVFDGTKSGAYIETDETNPLNTYGKTKRDGEIAITERGGRHLIFRTSWVYDTDGKNFANTMLNLGAEKEELSIVSDQIGAPTYAGHLAQSSLQALANILNDGHFHSGIYHLSNHGRTSWYDFAKAIFKQARLHGIELKVKHVTPIATKDYPTPAKRPHNSCLDCSKAHEMLNVTMPSWEEGLNAFFDIIQSRII